MQVSLFRGDEYQNSLCLLVLKNQRCSRAKRGLVYMINDSKFKIIVVRI
jgi:hypothetical protein